MLRGFDQISHDFFMFGALEAASRAARERLGDAPGCGFCERIGSLRRTLYFLCRVEFGILVLFVTAESSRGVLAKSGVVLAEPPPDNPLGHCIHSRRDRQSGIRPGPRRPAGTPSFLAAPSNCAHFDRFRPNPHADRQVRVEIVLQVGILVESVKIAKIDMGTPTAVLPAALNGTPRV